MGVFLNAQFLIGRHHNIFAFVVPAHAELAEGDPGHAVLARAGAYNPYRAASYTCQPNERSHLHEIGSDCVLAAAEPRHTADAKHVGADTRDLRAKRV